MSAAQTSERLELALAALREGRPVLVSDDPGREDEADLILAASTAQAASIGFMVRHTSGVLCAPLPQRVASRLGLGPMTAHNEDPKGTAYTVSCDAAGLSTGIGAAERARTLRALASPVTGPAGLTRPGHVFPLIAHPRGLAGRRGHTEAAVELARLAGLGEVGVIGEVVGEDGEPLKGAAVARFAREHGLVHLGLDDVAVPAPWASLPTRHGNLRVRSGGAEGREVLWIEVDGGPSTPEGQPPLVRVHSECLTSEALGSLRCDCAEQLDEALDTAARGDAVVLYVRGHEGRGIGLASKLRAYALQDAGADTVSANEALGRAPDERDYAAAAAALRDRGLTSVRLLSNNPAKARALREHGVDVTELVPTVRVNRPEASGYLRTKATRMGHLLGGGAA